MTGLWSATGASSRRTARFAVSISASLTAGLTTSVDMGKRVLKKNHGFSARCPAFFFQKLNMSAYDTDEGIFNVSLLDLDFCLEYLTFFRVLRYSLCLTVLNIAAVTNNCL